MLTSARMTRNCLSLICVIGLFVYTCGAETIASYSGQYTADLEQKQVLLQSISENLIVAEMKIKDTIESKKADENDKTSRLNSDHINLAEIMPPAEKINIAFIGMNGTLSPKSARDRLFQKRDNSGKQNN